MDRGTIWEEWQRLRSFGVFPTMVVWGRGKSLQAYWVLAEARKDNTFVEPYLTGRKRLPSSLPGYYSPGDESEAKYVAVNLRSAWKGHRVSVAWLKAQA